MTELRAGKHAIRGEEITDGHTVSEWIRCKIERRLKRQAKRSS